MQWHGICIRTPQTQSGIQIELREQFLRHKTKGGVRERRVEAKFGL